MIEVLQPYIWLFFGPLVFLAVLDILLKLTVEKREKRVMREMEENDDTGY